MTMTSTDPTPTPSRSSARPALPGLDCGLCGSRTCGEFGNRVEARPDLIDRCTHLAADARPERFGSALPAANDAASCRPMAFPGCDAGGCRPAAPGPGRFVDHLGREFDFYLEHFPEDPGSREVIIPHNPMLTRELDIRVGDVLIGRPLGMLVSKMLNEATRQKPRLSAFAL